MTKPLSVRIAGYAFLALAALGVWLTVQRTAGLQLDFRVLGVTAFLLSWFGFGIVWLAGTAAWRERVRGAVKEVEDRLGEVSLRRLAATAGPRLHMGGPAAAPPVTAEDCADCHLPLAVLWCSAHRAWRCWACAERHAEVCVGSWYPLRAAKRLLGLETK